MPISLRELQQWMRWIIVDPRGVQKALRNPYPKNHTNSDRYTSPKISAYHLIDKTGKINSKERLSVYAEGYFLRIAEVIETDFPTTKKILGEKSFLKLITDYLKSYPSRTFNIGEIARFLPIFVKTHSYQKNIPYLYDTVLLEWNMIESFYADNVSNLDLQAFSQISEDQWEYLQITLDPSLRFLQCNWPVDELWRNCQKENFDSIESAIYKKPVILCVYRSFGTIFIENITASELKVLKLLQLGSTLGELTQEIEAQESENFSNWFTKWSTAGFIKRIHLKKGD